jgi:hypothetical protein
MASHHKEGEEARESDEGMTNFDPYVAGKRVSLSMVSKGKQRGDQNFQQQRGPRPVPRGQPNIKQSDSESGGGISSVLRRIQSSLSKAAGLQQPPPPPTTTASRASLTSSSASNSGATKRPASSSSSGAAKPSQQQRQHHQQRPVTVTAARGKQPRQQQQQIRSNRPPPTSSKTAPQLYQHHHPSAPVLHQQSAAKGGRTRVRVSPSRSTRATSPPVRGGRPSSPSSKEGSPLVIDEMASFGPGSGRRNRPPIAQLPTQQLTNREQGLSVQSEQQQLRSKSEEPPSSPQWAELDPPRALDDGFGKALSNARQQQSSSSGDAHQITLMSYSDVHKHRAAIAKIPTAGGGGGASSKVGGGSVMPRSVKKPLNRQDLLKRIGSIENDEVSRVYTLGKTSDRILITT